MPIRWEDRYYLSAALVRKPFDPGDPAYGKIALLGHVRENSGNIQININDRTPTCVEGEETIRQFNLSPQVKTSAAWAGQPRNSDMPAVLNAGLILWVAYEPLKNDRRDKEMPYLALVRPSPGAAFSFVQKRCGESPHTAARQAFHDGMILVRDNQLVIPAEAIPGGFNHWRAPKQEQVFKYKRALIASGIDAEAALRGEPLTLRPLNNGGKGIPEDEGVLQNVTLDISANGFSRYAFPAFAAWGDAAGGNVLNLYRVAVLHVRGPHGKTVRDIVKGADANGDGANFGLFTPEQLVSENIAAPVKAYLQQRGSWPLLQR